MGRRKRTSSAATHRGGGPGSRTRQRKRVGKGRDDLNSCFEIGTEILKHFPGHGDFKGVIDEIRTCPSTKIPFYHVTYTDGDDEDISSKDISKFVVTASGGKPGTSSAKKTKTTTTTTTRRRKKGTKSGGLIVDWGETIKKVAAQFPMYKHKRPDSEVKKWGICERYTGEETSDNIPAKAERKLLIIIVRNTFGLNGKPLYLQKDIPISAESPKFNQLMDNAGIVIAAHLPPNIHLHFLEYLNCHVHGTVSSHGSSLRVICDAVMERSIPFQLVYDTENLICQPLCLNVLNDPAAAGISDDVLGRMIKAREATTVLRLCGEYNEKRKFRQAHLSLSDRNDPNEWGGSPTKAAKADLPLRVKDGMCDMAKAMREAMDVFYKKYYNIVPYHDQHRNSLGAEALSRASFGCDVPLHESVTLYQSPLFPEGDVEELALHVDALNDFRKGYNISASLLLDPGRRRETR